MQISNKQAQNELVEAKHKLSIAHWLAVYASFVLGMCIAMTWMCPQPFLCFIYPITTMLLLLACTILKKAHHELNAAWTKVRETNDG